MTHQSQVQFPNVPVETGRQVAQLRQALSLVEQIAGRSPGGEEEDAALDEGARFGSAYAGATPIAQRRFDTLAGEASAWAAAGVEALLAAGRNGRQPRAAARRLANELVKALRDLRATLNF